MMEAFSSIAPGGLFVLAAWTLTYVVAIKNAYDQLADWMYLAWACTAWFIGASIMIIGSWPLLWMTEIFLLSGFGMWLASEHGGLQSQALIRKSPIFFFIFSVMIGVIFFAAFQWLR